MNPTVWLLVVFLTFFFLYWKRLWLAFRERRRFTHMINQLPGPMGLPLVGSALNFSPDTEKCTYQMELYFRTYTEDNDSSGIMRVWIGPKPLVFIYKPETAKMILESQTLITKPGEYGILEKWLGTGLLTSTGEKWHTRRKMLTPTFHFSILNNFMKTLIENLDRHAADGYPFDFYKVIKALALDVICEAAMGMNIGAQRGHNTAYVSAVRKMCELSFLRMRSPWLWPEFAWWMSGRRADYNRSHAEVKRFIRDVIADRKAKYLAAKQRGSEKKAADDATEEKKRLAFLDLLLDLQYETGRLNDEDIREEVDTFMFEGHDTVSSSMGFFVFSMSQRLHLQEKVYEEMLEIFGDDEERDVTSEDISQMKYLEQCIREVMRLLPTVPIIGRIISEDTNIGGYMVPKNTTAMIAPFAVQRDKRFYHNPDAFDPDHFTPERVKQRNPFAYIPFSAGPRNCIGQKFAFTEQKIVLAKMFRRYRFIAHQHELESRGLPELILKPSHGFVIRVERRKQ